MICVRRWFSLDTPVSSTNKTDRHNITVILLKVALTTVTLSQEYNDWIIRVIKHTEIITNHIISVKLPYKYKYTKVAPYPIVLVFWISYRDQGELKIGSLRLEANIQWHFHQYNSYIGTWSFIGVGILGVPGKSRRSAISNWQNV